MTRKPFTVILNQFNATLDEESEENAGNLVADLPCGLIWNSSECHCLVEPFTNAGGQSWKPQAYADMAERMKMGTSPCDSIDCDTCEENRQ